MNDFIRLVDIQKSYTKNDQVICALEIKELILPDAGIFLLNGKSGAGKTTLLNILGLLDEPDQGSIIIAGEDAGNLSDLEKTNLRRKYFGFIFQGFNLIPTLSVLENIQLPLLPQGMRKEKKREIDSLLERVGLSSRSSHLPHELSQGEQQRASIVRALINNPKAILADEPTSSLDPENSKVILGLLSGIASEKKILLVISGNQPGLEGKPSIKLEAGKLI